MTPEERKLWYLYLKPHPAKFYKQKVIGPYITDFCCPSAKLIIELDGSQHYMEEGERYDKKRDRWLEGQGYYILRFSNYEVNRHFIQVCDMIEGTVAERTPLRQPAADTSPQRGGGKNELRRAPLRQPAADTSPQRGGGKNDVKKAPLRQPSADTSPRRGEARAKWDAKILALPLGESWHGVSRD